MARKEYEWKPHPRADGRMEYLCRHGCGHSLEVHGCDFCCSHNDFPLKGRHVGDIPKCNRCHKQMALAPGLEFYCIVCPPISRDEMMKGVHRMAASIRKAHTWELAEYIFKNLNPHGKPSRRWRGMERADKAFWYEKALRLTRFIEKNKMVDKVV